MPNITELIAKDKALYIPFSAITDKLQREWANGEDRILMRQYDEGDCDTIRWPMPNIENMKAALFDAREMGLLEGSEVLLPNGKAISF